MRVGDYVKAVKPFHLVSGCGVYNDAVVVSVEPLVLVSSGGDMLWSAKVRPDNVEVCGQADREVLIVAMSRYITDLRGEVEGSNKFVSAVRGLLKDL